MILNMVTLPSAETCVVKDPCPLNNKYKGRQEIFRRFEGKLCIRRDGFEGHRIHGISYGREGGLAVGNVLVWIGQEGLMDDCVDLGGG